MKTETPLLDAKDQSIFDAPLEIASVMDAIIWPEFREQTEKTAAFYGVKYLVARAAIVAFAQSQSSRCHLAALAKHARESSACNRFVAELIGKPEVDFLGKMPHQTIPTGTMRIVFPK